MGERPSPLLRAGGSGFSAVMLRDRAASTVSVRARLHRHSMALGANQVATAGRNVGLCGTAMRTFWGAHKRDL